jgi:hypothetical protein
MEPAKSDLRPDNRLALHKALSVGGSINSVYGSSLEGEEDPHEIVLDSEVDIGILFALPERQLKSFQPNEAVEA